jgi:hypothetical protein
VPQRYKKLLVWQNINSFRAKAVLFYQVWQNIKTAINFTLPLF